MSQFKVLMAAFVTKCIPLFANDFQFLYYVLKQCLSVLELIRAHWGIPFTVHLCLTELTHYGSVA